MTGIEHNVRTPGHGAMMRLSDPRRPLTPDYAAEPGGFAWWYADMIDERGDGFVLIWAFGLPFLPGYTDAGRRGRPQVPRGRPALNVALYRGGRPAFYLLQEYDQEDASWSPETERWRFGETVIERRTTEAGEASVVIDLDCALPSRVERLVGRVELHGRITQCPRAPTGVAPGDHEWVPVLGPARCRGSFCVGSKALLRVEGWGYHDRNGSYAPIDALGIDSWTWGRVVSRDATTVYYVLWPAGPAAPTVWGVRIGAGGELDIVDDLTAELRGRRRGRFGMSYAAELTLRRGCETWLTSRVLSMPEDGPFYLRARVTIELPSGMGGTGWSEWVRPDRVDLERHRPFVRMRVHDTAGSNSFWLPLFTGERSGRWRRVLSRGRGDA